MDPSTAAAIAAVAIAVLAFVVAFAQVLQQYFMTGSLIRLCDSVVYGPLPGRGRRVWQPGQFRFRVIYTLPQLRLEKSLWGEDGDDNVDLHEYSYIEEWSDRMYSRPSLIRRMCRQNSNTLLGVRHYVSRSFSFLIQGGKGLLHYVVPTTVAQNISARCSSLSFRRASTKYHAFVSLLRKLFNCTNGGFEESSLREGSEINLTIELSHSPTDLIDLFEPTGKRSGAASWTSFIWAVQPTSNNSLRFEVAEGDADRCPSDLPNVPMQVSLRDIIILGLQTGMKITSPNVDIETGKFSMVGPAGSITCSKHPILGSLLYFAPSGLNAGHGLAVNRIEREINRGWVFRIKQYVPVAQIAYGSTTYLDKLDGDWLSAARQAENFQPDERRNRRGLQRYTQDGHDDKKTTRAKDTQSMKTQSTNKRSRSRRSKNTQSRKSISSLRSTSSLDDPLIPSSPESTYDRKSQDIDSYVVDTTHDVHRRILIAEEPSKMVSQPSAVPRTEADDEKLGHHALGLKGSPAHDDKGIVSGAMGVASELDSQSKENCQLGVELVPAEDSVSMDFQGPVPASKDHLELAIIKSAEIGVPNVRRSETNLEEHEQGESLPSTSPSKAPTTPPVLMRDEKKVSSEGHDRKASRSSFHASGDPTGTKDSESRQDAQREKRTKGTRKRAESYDSLHYDSDPPHVNNTGLLWKWMSQMDIIPGYWATPWQSWLRIGTTKGALSAIMETLSFQLDEQNLTYVSPYGSEVKKALKWAARGESSWPMYAINARGGVIVQQSETKYQFPGFASRIAAVELLHYHRWQVERYMEPTETDDKLAELIMLDSWLTICGREPEILDGASDLAYNMPLLVQFMFEQFAERFENLVLTANEGGLQRIQSVARSLLMTLDDERLSRAEQIFTVVAMLRTAKVAACIINGANTEQIGSILDTDTRVWLV
ncbi:MAG: hypothetical protein Q9204_003250 [Flavoplaca sp. TL-2023a]